MGVEEVEGAMKLVTNWKRAHRMLSVQVAGAAVIFGSLPADQQTAILGFIGITPERIPAVLGLLFIVGRLVSQPKTQ